MSEAPVGPDIDGLAFLEHLGSGGYSDVFLYQRRSPSMKVAVKVLKDARLTGTELSQFAAEAETMAALADHPYIVQVFTTGATADGRPYLVMKYYPPPNLGIRAARERFSVADVLRTGVKIASAVETAHRAGILHRDIKPANILISAYGEPGLTDFGIAGHAADADDAEDLGVSIPWSPPEVLSGQSNGSPQSDVYSLAATVWHLLVGRSPFEIAGGDNEPRALMARVLTVPPPVTGRADVPTSLERLLQQAMAKNPAMRPKSALELARGLQAVEQEQRLGRTEIIVEGLGSASPSRPAPAGEQDRTHMRAPARVVAQPGSGRASTFAPRPSGPAAEPRTTARPTISAPWGGRMRAAAPRPEPESTIRRPAVSADTPQGDESAEPRRGMKRVYVGVITAAVIVIATVVSIVLVSRSPGKGGPSDSPPSKLANDQTALPGDVVSPPVVAAKYDPATKTVHFTWQADASAGASFAWWPQGNPAQQTRTDKTSVDVQTDTPATTCIQVVVIPAGGGAPSDPSSAVCGK